MPRLFPKMLQFNLNPEKNLHFVKGRAFWNHTAFLHNGNLCVHHEEDKYVYEEVSPGSFPKQWSILVSGYNGSLRAAFPSRRKWLWLFINRALLGKWDKMHNQECVNEREKRNISKMKMNGWHIVGERLPVGISLSDWMFCCINRCVFVIIWVASIN